jgi:transcriptional regulator with XRE-family HTH domain
MGLRFGSYLAQAIKRQGMTRRKFAIEVGYAHQNLHLLIRAERKPPINRIGRWSGVLGDAIDADLFRQLALLEHCPREIREAFLAQREQLDGR